MHKHKRRCTDEGHWFARGKEARHHGEARDKVDGRMSPAHRAAFQAGWDEQERILQPPTEEQLQKSRELLSRLKAAVSAPRADE